MQSEDQVYFLINHKLTRAYVTHRHAKNLRHVSPQNRFTLKEFETTTREIGLIIFRTRIFWVPLKHRTPERGTAEYGTTNPEQ